MITLDHSNLQLKLKKDNGKTLVYDPVRRKWLVLTPEEHVRQYTILYLAEVLKYPLRAMAVEKKILFGKLTKRFDLVVYDRDHKPWLLAECKEPETVVSQTTLQQLLSYHNTIQCRYWLLTNGHQTYCADAGDIHHIQWLEQLPAYDL